MDKVGFTLCLLGCAGMAEAYGNNKSMAISLVLLIVGGLMIGINDVTKDIKNYRRDYNANVLDRLYFLKK